jgi:hypothetical protein
MKQFLLTEKYKKIYFQTIHPYIDRIIRKWSNRKQKINPKLYALLIEKKLKHHKNLWPSAKKQQSFFGFLMEQSCGLRSYKETSFPDVSYTLNDRNFRQYMLPKGQYKIACFGCCNTFGYGLNDIDTWPYILNQKLKPGVFEVENYGLGRNGSNDAICRLIYSYLQTNKPYAIVCLFPPCFLHEFFNDNDELISLSPYVEWRQRIKYYKKLKAYNGLFNDLTSIFNFIKNFKFIETLCKLHNVQFIWHTWCLPDEPKTHLLFNIDTNTLYQLFGDKAELILKDNKLYNIMKKNNLSFLSDRLHHPAEYNHILASEFARLIKI